MFDLNNALRDWREQLRREGRCRADDVDELEEHLREEMAAFSRAGLSTEEAFLLAARRLGSVDVLGAEFEKVNAPSVWLNRFRWMAAGVVAYFVATEAAGAIRQLVGAGALLLGLNPYVAGIASVLAGIGAVTVAVVWIAKALLRERPTPVVACPMTLATCSGAFLAALLWFAVLPYGLMMFRVYCHTHLLVGYGVNEMTLVHSIGTLAFSTLIPLAFVGWFVRTAWRNRSSC